jgi:Trp operon repressor
MVAEKWLQMFIDIIREKRCVTRRYIIEQLLQMNLNQRQAENVVDEVLKSLLKRGVIVRKGRGVYCWSSG